MANSFLPRRDAGLLAWSLNFSTLVNAMPAAFGLTAPLAAGYAALHSAYATVLAACDPAIRTRAAVASKNLARENLKNNARLLASMVRGTASVTDAQKLALGLTVRSAPSPIPPPSSAPGLNVLSVSGWTAKVRLHDIAATQRVKPAGVNGASIFSYVGAAGDAGAAAAAAAAPPSDLSQWKFEGNTGRTRFDVTFDNTLPAGSRVWLTAFWFNPRKQSGPTCAPVGTNLPGGSVALAA